MKRKEAPFRTILRDMEIMKEKQSTIQVSRYLLNVRSFYHDCVRSLNLRKGFLFKLHIREWGKKALYCIEQELISINILCYFFLSQDKS